MRALAKAVVDVVWAAVGPLVARPPVVHPLGCHRPRVCDRLCLQAIIWRLVLGWKWSVAADAAGIPVGWAAEGANRNDITLFEPTMAEVERRGLHHDIDTVHLDRGYWGARVDRAVALIITIKLIDHHDRRQPH